MNENTQSLFSMKETVGSIQVLIEMMSEKYDELHSHVQQQDREIKALGRRVEQIEQAKVKPQLEKLKK